MQAANSFVCHINPIPDMSLGFLLWITSYIIERRGISLESQISTIFVVFNILILNCYGCVRACNLFCRAKSERKVIASYNMPIFAIANAHPPSLMNYFYSCICQWVNFLDFLR